MYLENLSRDDRGHSQLNHTMHLSGQLGEEIILLYTCVSADTIVLRWETSESSQIHEQMILFV